MEPFVNLLAKAAGVAAVVALGLAPPNGGAAPYLGPTPYLQATDSPLLGSAFSYLYVEDFEDGSVNAPGLVGFGGFVLGPASMTDSVDADDGANDGSGIGGHSFYPSRSSVLSFTFDAVVLGALPTHAGLVWTDVGFSSDVTTPCPNSSGSCGFGNVIFEAYDASGVSLGIFGPFLLGDGDVRGQTPEDRFFGVINPSGISRIALTMPGSIDWELDHVQYGHVELGLRQQVPEPNSALLLAIVVIAAGTTFRWRKRIY